MTISTKEEKKNIVYLIFNSFPVHRTCLQLVSIKTRSKEKIFSLLQILPHQIFYSHTLLPHPYLYSFSLSQVYAQSII
jgi:hypothetical protein